MKLLFAVFLSAAILSGCYKPSLAPDGGVVLAPCSGACKAGCGLLKDVADGATGGLVSMGCVLFCESALVKTMCDDAVTAKLDSWGWLSKLKDKLPGIFSARLAGAYEKLAGRSKKPGGK